MSKGSCGSSQRRGRLNWPEETPVRLCGDASKPGDVRASDAPKGLQASVGSRRLQAASFRTFGHRSYALENPSLAIPQLPGKQLPDEHGYSALGAAGDQRFVTAAILRASLASFDFCGDGKAGFAGPRRELAVAVAGRSRRRGHRCCAPLAILGLLAGRAGGVPWRAGGVRLRVLRRRRCAIQHGG